MIWERLKKNSLAQERLDELDRIEEEQRKVATSIIDPAREQVTATIHGLNIQRREARLSAKAKLYKTATSIGFDHTREALQRGVEASPPKPQVEDYGSNAERSEHRSEHLSQAAGQSSRRSCEVARSDRKRSERSHASGHKSVGSVPSSHHQ